MYNINIKIIIIMIYNNQNFVIMKEEIQYIEYKNME